MSDAMLEWASGDMAKVDLLCSIRVDASFPHGARVHRAVHASGTWATVCWRSARPGVRVFGSLSRQGMRA